MNNFNNTPLFKTQVNNQKITHLLYIVIVTTLTWLLYYNSLTVPFYLDDLRSIENNEIIKSGSILDVFNAYKMRAVGYLSFWGDYQISGEIKQFHVTNILIHMLNGILVYFFVYSLANKIKESSTKQAQFIAIASALIFIAHPLQTQAVTYIVQRLASLVTLFYLLALISYIHARNTTIVINKIIGFSIFFIAFALALFTKQNSVTLPIVIILIELIFFNQLRIIHLFYLLTISIIGIGTYYLFDSASLLSKLELIDKLTRENELFTRSDYFFAQVNILWVYIGKFFYPWPLRLEYGYDINHFSLFQTTISLLAHSATIALAFVYRKKLPLICFGILFFYISHIVESSIIPIKDFAFEHRMYLPITGLILSFVVFSLSMTRKLDPKYHILVSLGVLSLLSSLTLERNKQWQDPITFYNHELSYLPDNCRLLNNLAAQYYKLNNNSKGNQLIEHCFNVSNGKLVNYEFVSNYLAILVDQKQFDKANKVGLLALEKITNDPISKRRILENMGILHMKVNNLQQAEQYFKQALNFPNPFPKTYFALAVTLAKLGKYQEAHKYVLLGLEKEPTNKRGKIILSRLNALI